MDVNELAIEANEKGELEHDTIHDISLSPTTYKIKKLSRVNGENSPTFHQSVLSIGDHPDYFNYEIVPIIL